MIEVYPGQRPPIPPTCPTHPQPNYPIPTRCVSKSFPRNIKNSGTQRSISAHISDTAETSYHIHPSLFPPPSHSHSTPKRVFHTSITHICESNLRLSRFILAQCLTSKLYICRDQKRIDNRASICNQHLISNHISPLMPRISSK